MKFIKTSETEAINLSQVVSVEYSPAIIPAHQDAYGNLDSSQQPTTEQVTFTMITGKQFTIYGKEAFNVFKSLSS